MTSPYTDVIYEVVAPTTDLVIASAKGGNVVRTTNGGSTWNVVHTTVVGTSSPVDMLAIDFINPTSGLVSSYNGQVAKSNDGGATWSVVGQITGTNVWDMDMVTETHAWVAGTGERIYRTTDGGANWELQLANGGLGTYGISFYDTLNGVASGSGGNTWFTTNGGVNWIPAVTPPSGTQWGVHFVTSPVHGSFAMTAGASGNNFSSTDGGRTWIQEKKVSISTMDDVYMTDAANAWVVGSSGTILKYTNMGNIPVELSNFSASVNGNNVSLSWTTATELNNAGFEIERFSEELSQWQTLTFIKGKGTSTEVTTYSYTDINLTLGSYDYRLKQIDLNGSYTYYNLSQKINVGSPTHFELLQNYPNPFNPSTVIEFSLPDNGFTSLIVFDALGREVKVLRNAEMNGGYHQIYFDASGLSSGVYFYTLKTGKNSVTKKMMLTK
jgi:photosystem II stability/assembly factor-like uncharacterized protein